MVTVRLPIPLVSVTGLDKASFSVSGDCVLDALSNLCAEHPQLRAHFFNSAGAFSDNPWALFLNGEHVEPSSAVKQGDELEVMTGMSGGTVGMMPPVAFSKEEIRRYARHLTLPQVGRIGQARLKNASVLIVGAGGLGSPVALYLSAAGVGKIGVVDPDVVEESNLQRQVLHDVDWIGKPKVDSARDRMQKINPNIEIIAIRSLLDENTVDEIVKDYDVIVDGSDNFNTRTTVNRAARRFGIPLVFAAVYQFEGHVSVFNATPESPCYQCVFTKLPTGDLAPNCAAGGVIGVVPGILGLFQANEVIKLLLGVGEILDGRMLVVDALQGRTRELRFQRQPKCPVCGDGQSGLNESVFCQTDIPIAPIAAEHVLSPTDLSRLLHSPTPPTLIDVREPGELEICEMTDAINIPVGRLGANISALDPGKDYVLFCRSGARSARALGLLRAAGFPNVRHLDGGLLRWAREVDSEMVVV
jgi:sulfur-carrier protein adenylyltransferase/sulfurtransferase